MCSCIRVHKTVYWIMQTPDQFKGPGKKGHSKKDSGVLMSGNLEAEEKKETQRGLLKGLFDSNLCPPLFLLCTQVARKQKSDHDNPLLKSL